MEQFTKIDETTVQETITQPDMVVNTTLDSLIEQKNVLTNDITRMATVLENAQAELVLIEKKIVAFKDLGIKTAQEVETEKALGVIE